MHTHAKATLFFVCCWVSVTLGGDGGTFPVELPTEGKVATVGDYTFTIEPFGDDPRLFFVTIYDTPERKKIVSAFTCFVVDPKRNEFTYSSEEDDLAVCDEDGAEVPHVPDQTQRRMIVENIFHLAVDDIRYVRLHYTKENWEKLPDRCRNHVLAAYIEKDIVLIDTRRAPRRKKTQQ